ncbi:MAG: SurA N-terminal domain-containing protein [Candidatus Omnitrophota bacterium]
MLKVFRHKGVTKKVLWVVAGLIIVSFAFGGMAMRYGTAFSLTQSAGKIFGQNISLKEFQKNYQDVHDQAVMTHGANAEKFIPMMNLDDETWTRIILLKAAQERGIKVGDMEVIQYIGSIPFFQRDGQFDKRLYTNIVTNVFQREARDFEEGLRNQIKIMKLFSPELKKITLTDEMIRQEYERRNQKVRVSYVMIAPDSLTEGINPDDAKLKEFFTSQRDNFMEPEAVSATIISLPFDAKASGEEKSKTAANAQELVQKLNAGTDLAVAAKSFNATVKETGFFNIDSPSADLTWSFELLQQIFSAKTGDILAPSENANSFKIVKITGKKPAFIPEFEAVQDKVKDAYIKTKSMEAAQVKAAQLQKDIAEKLKSAEGFSAIATGLKLEAKQTGFFGTGEYIPEIGLSDDFTTAAFKLTKDNPLSDVVATSRGPVILYWDAAQPADIKKFEIVKKEFEDSLFAEERIRVMNELLRSLRDKAKLESYLDKINAQQKKAMDKMRTQ